MAKRRSRSTTTSAPRPPSTTRMPPATGADDVSKPRASVGDESDRRSRQPAVEREAPVDPAAGEDTDLVERGGSRPRDPSVS